MIVELNYLPSCSCVRSTNLHHVNQQMLECLRALVIIFQSLKREVIKKQGEGVESRPLPRQAGMITTSLPVSRLLETKIFETIKCYPYIS